MNTKQQNILRSLLKKYKYKSVSNIVRQNLEINFENFLQKAEPLYIIPRIASCYAEKSDKKQLLTIVQKEWLKDVVEKEWVEPLNEYTEQYGTRTVLSAIYYLIDNNLWESYEGRMCLDAQAQANYYDKLNDMPSAIALVQEEQQAEAEKAKGKEEAQAEAEKQAPVYSLGQFSSAPSAQNATLAQNTPHVAPSSADSSQANQEYILDAGQASATIYQSVELGLQLKENLDRLADYIYTAEDTDVLRKKISNQQKEIADLKAQHEQEISALQKKMEENACIMQKQSDCISQLRDEARKVKLQHDEQDRDAQKQYDELNQKYKKALDERDDADKELAAYKKLLEEEANREQLPKKKVIPFSALDAVPLLGKGVMTGLEPVLARYNIVVDYNK